VLGEILGIFVSSHGNIISDFRKTIQTVSSFFQY